MAYTKKDWEAGVTPLSEENMDHLETQFDEAIATAAADVDADIITHNNNTTTAHGAVSAATASKIVVRDASARAKFAAPGAAGDALIKGTRIAITDLPALTNDKVWMGVGGVPAETAWPASPLTVAETEVYNAAAPVAWTDLDLSGIVGSQATLVLLKIKGDGSVQSMAVRKNGDTDEFLEGAGITGCALIQSTAAHKVVLVATDASGVIEIGAVNTDNTTIDVIAYIK